MDLESDNDSDESETDKKEEDPLEYKFDLQRHLADLLPGDLVRVNLSIWKVVNCLSRSFIRWTVRNQQNKQTISIWKT